MGAETGERMTRIHKLELKHRDNMHKTDSIKRDEEARLLKVRFLISRDEIVALKDDIALKNAKIAAETKQSDKFRVELAQCMEAARAQEAWIKKQDLQLAKVKAELNSLSGSKQDAGKALQEKLSLTRELNRIKPELENLQLQLASYQAMVGERNDLRRQVDSLEVELDNEKRSRQRAQPKEDDSAIAELKTKLDKAEQKLLADKKEREKARKQHERDLAEAQSKNERLEDRIESLKAKYKSVHGELKETRTQLQMCQDELQNFKRTDSRSKDGTKKTTIAESGRSRKRPAQEMSFEDIVIQTPGNVEKPDKRPAARKRGEKTALGAKSTFSITPFLKKTKSLSDETLEASADDESDVAGPDSTFVDKGNNTGQTEAMAEPLVEDALSELAPGLLEDEPVLKSKAQPKVSKPRGRPRTKGLTEATSVQANKVPVKAVSDTAVLKPGSCLKKDKVAEVSVMVDQENVTAKTFRNAPALLPKVPEGDVKKKRRKLLGAVNSTLLDGDDEDCEATAKPAKPTTMPSKRARTQLGGVRNAFAGASFSPLKRDRRGVNASFLA
ncbi:Rossmann-fold NAD-binding protein [Drechmeria coniospora]|uniref:Rossmann-fold NAD-binding protein n=1 Tax=Drechmeria coniospora TaxID=98403 RepID=A0A151GLR6_DRECN|nr:Rossmann-fold NAD-binding protein [Drechmeria coniospora]KYK58047.1 Rossmann-fold NAD-binding protein [Drechmeria coniospora]